MLEAAFWAKEGAQKKRKGISLYIKWVKPELNNVDGDLCGASLIQSEMKSQSFTITTQLSFIWNLLAN